MEHIANKIKLNKFYKTKPFLKINSRIMHPLKYLKDGSDI